jgi:predicted RNA-binding Zn ribbon-like protein
VTPDFVVLDEPLAIELVNTTLPTDDGPRDLLWTDEDAAAWVSAHADRLPAGAAPSVERLTALRDAIRNLIEAAMALGRPEPRALRAVNTASALVPVHPVLRWPDLGPQATEASAPQAKDGWPGMEVLAAIARSAIQLLGAEEGPRLRRCEGPDCVLLFVATNPRRRWCSPSLCGNRVRVARHYDRHLRAR